MKGGTHLRRGEGEEGDRVGEARGGLGAPEVLARPFGIRRVMSASARVWNILRLTP